MSETPSRCPTCGTPAVLKEGYLPNPVENWKPLPSSAAVTPLQAAALATLVAWRKADALWQAAIPLPFNPTLADALNDAERELRSVADRVLAELGVQG